MEQFPNVFVMDHPLIQHKLTFLRDQSTGTKFFRELVSEIAMLMCYEATRDLPLVDVENGDPHGEDTPPRSSPGGSWPLCPFFGRAWAWWTAC